MAREHWLWLAVRPACTERFRSILLEQFGSPEAVWQAGQEELDALPRMNARRMQALLDKDLTYVHFIEETCRQKNIRIITREDADYPAPLRTLTDAPLVLYVRGTLPDFSQRLTISVVGTRKCTEYGIQAARYFAGTLAQNDCIIVSGMALGIDGAANQAAIEAGGTTIAVLGSGIDVCYPWEHRDLMEEITEHGAVISEYPPGTEPLGRNFPVRNRIITGLSQGTLVIEAPKHSGALISADLALEQGREVFAVPGTINRPKSEGCNDLIRRGSAELAQKPSDILAHYGKEENPSQPREKQVSRPERRPKKSERQLSIPEQNRSVAMFATEEAKTVWLAVYNGHKTVDAIVEATGYTVAEVLTELTMLEVEAFVIRTSSGYRPAADVKV